jgi:hypothetical protein
MNKIYIYIIYINQGFSPNLLSANLSQHYFYYLYIYLHDNNYDLN